MEIWREVPGYDGWYECSNLGGVRSWRTVGIVDPIFNEGYDSGACDGPY